MTPKVWTVVELDERIASMNLGELRKFIASKLGGAEYFLPACETGGVTRWSMPGYVFCLGDVGRGLLWAARGCSGVGRRIGTVGDAVVAEARRKLQEGLGVAELRKGMRVVILAGDYAKVRGVVEEMTAGIVRVRVPLRSRELVVEVEQGGVEPAP